MKRLFLVVTLLIVQPCATAGSAAEYATGSWSWHGTQGGGGWLKTIQSGKKVRFQLELSRGAPSHNSGFIEGEFELTGKEGTFQTDQYGACDIAFSFEGMKVVVGEEANQCGFGYGVSASGTYTLESAATPMFSRGDPRTGDD